MLGSTIQRELAEYIMREANDPRLEGGLISITRVKVNDDLSMADVFVTIMGTPGHQTAALNALKHSAGLMRTKLNKALSLRQAPYLRFAIDEQLKKEIETLDLLERVRRESEEYDRRQAERAAQQGQEPSGQDEQDESGKDEPGLDEQGQQEQGEQQGNAG